MNFPNYLTLFRILLVPFVFSYLIYYDNSHPNFRILALALFFTAAVTDAVDGFIARRFHLKTELGSFLDPFADKLLIVTGFFGILFSNGLVIRPPVWVVIIVVFRELLIICGLVIIFLTTKQMHIQPNMIGKITTAFQMATIISVLFQWNFAPTFWIGTAILTVLSGGGYIIRRIRILSKGTSP